MSIMIISTPEFQREWNKLCENVIKLMKEISIDPDCNQNLVDINYYFHKHLHSSHYLMSVNTAVIYAYPQGRDRVDKRIRIFTRLFTFKKSFLGLNDLLK